MVCCPRLATDCRRRKRRLRICNATGKHGWRRTIRTQLALWACFHWSKTCRSVSLIPSTGGKKVFKHRVGTLRSVVLDDAEADRLADLKDNELVLQSMPACLVIEISDGHEKPILFELKSEYVVWSRDPAGYFGGEYWKSRTVRERYRKLYFGVFVPGNLPTQLPRFTRSSRRVCRCRFDILRRMVATRGPTTWPELEIGETRKCARPRVDHRVH